MGDRHMSNVGRDANHHHGLSIVRPTPNIAIEESFKLLPEGQKSHHADDVFILEGEKEKCGGRKEEGKRAEEGL